MNIQSRYKNKTYKEILVTFGSHGIKLQGKITIPEKASPENPVPGAVLCHGFGADRKIMEPSAILLAKKGIASIIFDLRGHGLSEGYLDGNTHEDVIDAWQTLVSYKEVDGSRIALIGHSLGASSSILAAGSEIRPKAIVALSCPHELNEKFIKYYVPTIFPIAKWIIALIGKLVIISKRLKVNVDWKKFLKSMIDIKLTPILERLDDCHKLFVFSTGDPITPYKRFSEIYERACHPKQKMLTRGSHVTPVEAELIQFEWIGWIVSMLKSPRSAFSEP